MRQGWRRLHALKKPMAIANKINATAMSTNRAKVCIYLLSPLALDLPFEKKWLQS
jgi:hypothetical protein